MNRQLALSLQINIEATFNDFCWHGNDLVKQQLEQTLTGIGNRFIYLWGTNGSGKSHLLQACCHAVNPHKSAIYLPLMTLKHWGSEVLEGIEEQSVICIDDIDAIAKNTLWEEALFHLYNRVHDKEQTIFIMSGHVPPPQLPILLPDLRSRLSFGLVLALHELSDEDKINTLQLHANKRGFVLSNSVGHFLINRCARNMHELHSLLNRLDEASLVAQRKITIPFVKEVLGI